MRTLLLTLTIVACAGVVSPVIAHFWLDPLATLVGRWNPNRDALDFNIFYAAADRVLHGQPQAIYTPSALSAIERSHGNIFAAHETLPYLNPPFFALMMAPLALLPFPLAYQLWTAFNMILLAMLSWMTWDLTRTLPRPWRLALVIAVATSLPIALTIQLGQFSLILSTCWMLAYRLFRSGRDELAGLALAPLLIKPEMLLPLGAILIWRRRTSAFRTLVPATAAAVAVSFAVVGLHEGLRYPFYLYDHASKHLPGTETDIMFGWNGLIDSFVPVTVGFASTLAAPLALLSLFVAALCWRRPIRPGTDDLAAPWLIATMATLLTDPHLYFQDIALLVPVACVYLCTLRERERLVTSVLLGTGWCILAVGLAPNKDWGINLFGLYLAVTFVALVLHMLRHGASAAAHVAPAVSASHPVAAQPLGSSRAA